jgi:hypothetical protein
MQESHNEKRNISQSISFVYKVNNSKINKKDTLECQVKKVIERIKNKYELLGNSITLRIGVGHDDFINDKFTLRIETKYAQPSEQSEFLDWELMGNRKELNYKRHGEH